ncbi:hypothetical protein [Ornithinimicrobium sediminis]|uniref:hypothetical protein n=1 Tax=Ornithinimicrobium sediminis TaxID=2904603 RepID=UPI001E3478CE|nr:hypothetical protein [Ornithinimicrobium sediminis]MCE0488426.1 hypothetical protein [Ornithinimicrobium sediminis]
MPFRRWIWATPLTTTLAAVLASCASSGGFSDLDRDREPKDSVPEVVAFPDDVEVVPDSSRSVGEYEGAELWLTRTEDDGVCLLVYPDDVDWVVGCSDIPPLTVRGPAGGFTVVSDGQDPPENATTISENVYGP